MTALWRRLFSFLRQEYGVVAIGAIALSVLLHWPIVVDPASRIPQDIGDPLLIAWELAWPGFILLIHPTQLWSANTFYPEPDSFALTDSFLGYAPFSFIGDGQAATLVRFNIIFILVAAFAFFAGYLLARQLGARWPGALLVAVAFAYAPWRLSQASHLHVISSGGIALALFALAKGHGFSFRDGYQPDKVRPGWAAAGWAIASWQIMIGFGIGLPFSYALVVIGLVAIIGWLVAGRPRFPQALLVTNILGALFFMCVAYLMARPYLRVAERYPDAKRDLPEIDFYSPLPKGLLISPAESWLWGDAHEGARAGLSIEHMILPGFVIITLALVGLFLSAWSVQIRALLAAGVIGSAILALGTKFWHEGLYTYQLAWKYLPGWDAIRTPGRLVLWTTLLLALLAAGAVTRFAELLTDQVEFAASSNPRPRKFTRALVAVVLIIPAVFAFTEGISTREYPLVPTVPPSFTYAVNHHLDPMVVLPSSWAYDHRVMYWSTDRFPEIVNGFSGFAPPSQGDMQKALESFPDENSIRALRYYKVKTVLVLRKDIIGTTYANTLTKPSQGLPLKRTDRPDAVIFQVLS